MILYRSIGDKEFRDLFLDTKEILGIYNCAKENYNTCSMTNAACFFIDDVMWHDKEHKYLIVVDIPIHRLEIGVGQYDIAKSFAKTHVWSGRTGTYAFGLREAYTVSYSIKDVREVYIFNEYACNLAWCNISDVENTCDLYNIKMHLVYSDDSGYLNRSIFIKDKRPFVKDVYHDYDYISCDFSLNRETIISKKVNSNIDDRLDDFINDTIEDVLYELNKKDKNSVKLAEYIQEYFEKRLTNSNLVV